MARHRQRARSRDTDRVRELSARCPLKKRLKSSQLRLKRSRASVSVSQGTTNLTDRPSRQVQLVEDRVRRALVGREVVEHVARERALEDG